MVTTAQNHKGWTISIFEIGSTLTRIKSFPLQFNSPLHAFSPTTYRVSTAGDDPHDPKLLILDICNSEVLLHATGSYWDPTFSPDASFLAAFTGNHLLVWKYTSGHYIQWREFQQTQMSLQFSPSSLSILGCNGTLLHLLHLDYTSTAPTMESITTTHDIPRDAYSPCSTYIATTGRGESVITITNLHSQAPSPCQLIITNFEIAEIVLTGNVLLAKGSDIVMAWLLTEDGMVDGVFGNREADHNDSLWSISSQDTNPTFWARLLSQERGSNNVDEHVEFSNSDGIVVIRWRNKPGVHVYHAETGEILKPDKASLHLRHTWYRFYNPCQDDCNLYHHDLHKLYKHLECDWQISQSTLQEGWVKDPEGKHQLWLYPHWRLAGNDVEWLNKVSTLQLKSPSELIIIKF
ncbi:hypothetical protein BDM02DRAFT_3194313 [Thelephora ganbajun]|uniref:Uncharacterized protein n=1 Tax=Thelephora ganbajun TaxID=370292 RepID=A0ACB6YWU2_THEGA|nr:hypothetical protein BDM02DRAFT_3194313 [Thelephora ganbajun]